MDFPAVAEALDFLPDFFFLRLAGLALRLRPLDDVAFRDLVLLPSRFGALFTG